MKCHEARRYLDPFLDGEIEVETNMKVLEHLNLCLACSRIYEGEKSLRGVYRERLRSKAPAALASNLSRALDRRVASPWGRRLATAMAASIFLAIVVMLLFSPPVPVSAASFAERAVAEHVATREVPPGPCICTRGCCCLGDRRDKLQSFYKQELSYAPCMHDFPGYETCYGAVWEAAPGKKVCWTSHQDASGRRVSHVSVGGVALRVEGGETIRKKGLTFHRYEAAGHPVVVASLPGGMT